MQEHTVVQKGENMSIGLRILSITLSIAGILSFAWFLLGSTAYFQRGMDIVGTTYLWGGGVPLLLLCILFMVLVIKKWTPMDTSDYVGFYATATISVLLSAALAQSVATQGSVEKFRSDTLKITTDGAYEYQIDLINLFQRNSRAQLYLKHVSTGEEQRIPLSIQTQEMITLSMGKVNHWARLEPTEDKMQYILHTTEELGIPEESFIINVEEGRVSRLE